MTPDEYAAQEVGRLITLPHDRSDALLRRGVRYQITKEDALEEHRSFIETALELNYPVAAASIQFHGLPLPKGYVQEGGVFMNTKHKMGKRYSPASI